MSACINDLDIGIEKYIGSFDQDDLGVTQIPTETIRALKNMPDLALFTFLASCSKSWKLNAKHLAAHFGCNKEKIYKAIDSLIDLGFLTRSISRTKGKFAKYHYRLHLRQIVQVTPFPEKPDTVKPDTVNPDTYKTDILPLENKEVITTTTEEQPKKSSSSNIFNQTIDNELLALRARFIKNDEREPQEFLKQCKWHIDNGSKDHTNSQKLNGLRKIIKGGVFDTPATYPKPKANGTGESDLVVYSQYVNGLKQDINLGLLPANSPIPEFEEWKQKRA